MVGRTAGPDSFDKVVRRPRAVYTLPLHQGSINQDHIKAGECPHPYIRTETSQSYTSSEYK